MLHDLIRPYSRFLASISAIFFVGFSSLAFGVEWSPTLNSDPEIQPPKWDWQLEVPVVLNADASIEIYDIDMFDNETNGKVAELKNAGKKVICYLDVGSWEDFRDDADDFPAEILGNVYDGFPDERWLDIRDVNPSKSTTGAALAAILEVRFDRAQSMGCDGVEPDNMDVYDETAHDPSGFPLSYEDQIYFNLWVAEQVHARGMAVGLKNDINQAQDQRMIDAFDFVVSEECAEYGECNYFSGFLAANKPVFLAEYNLQPANFCPQAKALRISAIKKRNSLDEVRSGCDSYYSEVIVPEQPTLVSPGETGSSFPTFVWNALSTVAEYYLWVNDDSGTPIRTWYSADSVGCGSGSGTCTLASPVALRGGRVQWWVQARNSAGTGPWSSSLNFTTGEGAVPGEASLISPADSGVGNNPTYRWNTVVESSWYHLWVNDSTGTPINRWYTAAQAGCSDGSGVCSVVPESTVNGASIWWIRTWNSFGYGPWSQRMTFTPTSIILR